MAKRLREGGSSTRGRNNSFSLAKFTESFGGSPHAIRQNYMDATFKVKKGNCNSFLSAIVYANGATMTTEFTDKTSLVERVTEAFREMVDDQTNITEDVWNANTKSCVPFEEGQRDTGDDDVLSYLQRGFKSLDKHWTDMDMVIISKVLQKSIVVFHKHSEYDTFMVTCYCFKDNAECLFLEQPCILHSNKRDFPSPQNLELIDPQQFVKGSYTLEERVTAFNSTFEKIDFTVKNEVTSTVEIRSAYLDLVTNELKEFFDLCKAHLHADGDEAIEAARVAETSALSIERKMKTLESIQRSRQRIMELDAPTLIPQFSVPATFFMVEMTDPEELKSQLETENDETQATLSKCNIRIVTATQRLAETLQLCQRIYRTVTSPIRALEHSDEEGSQQETPVDNETEDGFGFDHLESDVVIPTDQNLAHLFDIALPDDQRILKAARFWQQYYNHKFVMELNKTPYKIKSLRSTQNGWLGFREARCAQESALFNYCEDVRQKLFDKYAAKAEIRERHSSVVSKYDAECKFVRMVNDVLHADYELPGWCRDRPRFGNVIGQIVTIDQSEYAESKRQIEAFNSTTCADLFAELEQFKLHVAAVSAQLALQDL